MRVSTLPETRPHEHNGYRHVAPVPRSRRPAVQIHETDDELVIEIVVSLRPARRQATDRPDWERIHADATPC